MGIAENDVAQVRQVLSTHLKQFEIGPDLYRFPLSFWVVTAVTP